MSTRRRKPYTQGQSRAEYAFESGVDAARSIINKSNFKRIWIRAFVIGIVIGIVIGSSVTNLLPVVAG